MIANWAAHLWWDAVSPRILLFVTPAAFACPVSEGLLDLPAAIYDPAVNLADAFFTRADPMRLDVTRVPAVGDAASSVEARLTGLPEAPATYAAVVLGMVEDGTAIGSALASASRRLGDNPEAHTRLIVLLTDGDNNAGQISPNTAAEAAHALGMKVYTICAGSRGYAPIPVRDMFGNTTYQQVLVTVDEAQVRRVAEIGGGKFYRATDSESLRNIFSEIDQLEKVPVEAQRSRSFRELFYWPLNIGMALTAFSLMWSLSLGRRLP
jgi:hypothetical protein